MKPNSSSLTNRYNKIAFSLFVIVLINGILLFILEGCNAGEKKSLSKVILAEAMQPVCAPVYVAIDKGFFIEHGIEVQTVSFQKGKLCLDAVLGGKADIATVAETPIMHVGFQNQPIAILSSIHNADKNTKCVARKDKKISKPQDLKGHRIGVPIGGNAEYLMDIFLMKYGLSRKDVTIINLNPPEMVGAIVRGDIDASFSWEPYVTRTINQVGEKNTIVFYGDDIYRETFELVSMKDWSLKNSVVAENFLRALIEAVDYIQKHRDESIRIVSPHVQLDTLELSRIWNYYTFSIELREGLNSLLRDQAKWAIASGIQKGEIPDYSKMFFPKALISINPSLVDSIFKKLE